jgi:NADH-quinone oxidoreductase subunit J
MEFILFSILSVATLFFALMTIISKTPVYSLLYIILCFFCIAGHFALLNAQFLAAVQIIVYAGAIMVLFLFTLMLLNLNKESEKHKPILMKLAAVISSGSLLFLLILAIQKSKFIAPTSISDPEIGMVKNLGKILLNEYAFPFEFISILLLSAMIGAVLLSKKEKETAK